jgi:hypothetical protein
MSGRDRSVVALPSFLRSEMGVDGPQQTTHGLRRPLSVRPFAGSDPATERIDEQSKFV